MEITPPTGTSVPLPDSGRPCARPKPDTDAGHLAGEVDCLIHRMGCSCWAASPYRETGTSDATGEFLVRRTNWVEPSGVAFEGCKASPELQRADDRSTFDSRNPIKSTTSAKIR